MPERESSGARGAVLRAVADILTGSRLVLAVALTIMGARWGEAAFTAAVALIAFGWTADTLDGHFAEWAGDDVPTLFAGHDVTVDVVFSCGGLAYFVLAGFVPPLLAAAYLLAGVAILLFLPSHSTAVALQAPVAALPAVFSFIYRPGLGLIIVIWAAVLLVADYRRFRWRLSRFRHGITGLLPSRKADPHPDRRADE